MILTEQTIIVGKSLAKYQHPSNSNVQHEGIIVQETSSHIRIYKPDRAGKDCSQISSELFPKDYCILAGEIKDKIRIEPQIQGY